MKVFVSNDIEKIADALALRLYEYSDPFVLKTVVVSSHAMKNYLLLHFAKKLGVAAGMKIVTTSAAIQEFFPDVPSPIALSLKIEALLSSSSAPEVFRYLSSGSARQKAELGCALADLFLKYGSYGKKPGLDWQKEIWEKVFEKKDPWENKNKPKDGLYLFNTGYLPKRYLDFLWENCTDAFFLSPCAMYWGDILSPKGKEIFLEKIDKNAADLFEGIPPLLAYCGKMGQRLFRELEDKECIDLYQERGGKTYLEQQQNALLKLEKIEAPLDSTVELFAAPTRAREVEIVFDLVRRKNVEPSKVLILAPDIRHYAPHIHRVFGAQDGIDYTISGLEMAVESPLAQGLDALLQIAKEEFRADTFFKLFSYSNFLEKLGATREEAKQFCHWVEKAHIRCDWEEGIGRLVRSLAVLPNKDSPWIELSEADLLGKWLEVVSRLRSFLSMLKEEKTVTGWMGFFLNLAKEFFSLVSEDAFVLESFHTISKIDAGVVSFQSIQRVLETVFGKRGGVFQGSHLQAVRFASLEEGCATEADLVVLIGMQDGSFPRSIIRSSLEMAPFEEAPSLPEQDRYLLLEAFLAARRFFVMSYISIDSEDGKIVEPSPLIQQVFPSLVAQKCSRHGFRFVPTQAKPLFSFEKKSSSLPPVFEIHDLKKAARNPLEFFLNKTLRIYCDKTNNPKKEFVLSHFDRSDFRRASLKRSIAEIVHCAEKNGKLPEGEFRKTAVRKIEEEVAEYHQALHEMHVQPSSVFSVLLAASCLSPEEVRPGLWVLPPLRIEDTDTVILGRINDLTPQGLLFHGDDNLESSLKAWPLWAIIQKLDLPIEKNLLLTKKGVVKNPPFKEKALNRFCTYVASAIPTASPLMPGWAEEFFKGPQDFAKAVAETGMFEEESLQWLRARTLLPDAMQWHNSWSSYLKEVFCEAF